MGALQKVSLGTAPTGTDGDTVRTANVKANANVDVLTTQAILTSSSPNAVRDLTAADMGKRINFTPTAAASVHFPAANTTGVDQLVAVHNLSTAYDITMAIATGSGDTAPTIVVVKPGEMLTWETDGVSVWRTIGRKKAFDEVVQGKLTVAGALTAASLAIGAAASISAAGAFSGASAAYSGNVTVGGTLGVTGQAAFTLRPTFAGNTPWDSGNLSLGGAKISSVTSVADTPYSGSAAFADMTTLSFVHKGPNGVAIINISGEIGVAGTSSNLTCGYDVQLIDAVTSTVIDDKSDYQDMLSVVGNWSNFYHYSITVVGAGLVVGRQYNLKIRGFKNVNVGPISITVKMSGICL